MWRAFILPQTLSFLQGHWFSSLPVALRSSILDCSLTSCCSRRIIICISHKLNLLKGTIWQIKLEAAGIVMRTLASCPHWFELVSATSTGWAVLLVIKQQGTRGERRSPRVGGNGALAKQMENMSVLQRLRQQPNYCFRLSLFLSFFCFWMRKQSLALLFCVSKPESSMVFQPLNTLLHLTLSGMLEQHWGSYICRRAWALCCRSPKPAVNQGAWSGSYVGLAKLKAKYTLLESKWLYLKPNPMNSLFRKTHASLHAMPQGHTRRTLPCVCA